MSNNKKPSVRPDVLIAEWRILARQHAAGSEQRSRLTRLADQLEQIVADGGTFTTVADKIRKVRV